MNPEPDELLKKADALMMRRRSFVARGGRAPAPDDDLPLLTEIVSEAEEAAEARIAAAVAAMEAEMEQRIAALLPGRVEEALPQRLAEVLPERVEEALAQRMAEVLPQEIERALPDRIAQELPAKLEAALELALAEHLAALQPRLTLAVQAWLATEIPQLVTRQLDTVSEQITREVATQFRVTLLPELDALLTPPETGTRR